VPRRALSSLLRVISSELLELTTGFSAPKGIVFIATINEDAELGVNLPEAGDWFQCPEGHCLHCYQVGRWLLTPDLKRELVSVPRRALSSLLPEGDPSLGFAFQRFSAPKGIVFIATP